MNKPDLSKSIFLGDSYSRNSVAQASAGFVATANESGDVIISSVDDKNQTMDYDTIRIQVLKNR